MKKIALLSVLLGGFMVPGCQSIPWLSATTVEDIKCDKPALLYYTNDAGTFYVGELPSRQRWLRGKVMLMVVNKEKTLVKRHPIEVSDKIAEEQVMVTFEGAVPVTQNDIYLMERKVAIGMSESDVVASWGQPIDKNCTITAGGRREQWVYGGGGYARQYVYIENGKVVGIQN